MDKVLPVDIYVPGCAARHEAIMDGMILKAGETIFTVSDETSPSGSSFQGVAKSANELKNTVTNWDSSLWKEGGNGYPVFKWSK